MYSVIVRTFDGNFEYPRAFKVKFTSKEVVIIVQQKLAKNKITNVTTATSVMTTIPRSSITFLQISLI